jgi:hypothetical protein
LAERHSAEESGVELQLSFFSFSKGEIFGTVRNSLEVTMIGRILVQPSDQVRITLVRIPFLVTFRKICKVLVRFFSRISYHVDRF